MKFLLLGNFSMIARFDVLLNQPFSVTARTHPAKTLCIAALMSFAANLVAAAESDLITGYDAYKKNNQQVLTSLYQQQQNLNPQQAPEKIYTHFWLALLTQAQSAKNMQLPYQDQYSIAFAKAYPNHALTQRMVSEWIKTAAKHGGLQSASTQQALSFAKLNDLDKEAACYFKAAQIQKGSTNDAPTLAELKASGKMTEGCVHYMNLATQANLLDPKTARNLVRQLLAHKQTQMANLLAPAAKLNLAQEQALIQIIEQNKQSATVLAAINGFSTEQLGFAYGQLATSAAVQLRDADAKWLYQQADLDSLNHRQWDWLLRNALRTNAYSTIISHYERHLPQSLKASQAWRYWYAHALTLSGKTAAARPVYEGLTKHNTYYGLLSQEALGWTLKLPVETVPQVALMNTLAKEPSIALALTLFEQSERLKQGFLREEAKLHWRYAMKVRSDDEYLAAAKLAQDAGFYEMAIFSAEQTNERHHFGLRYPLHHESIIRKNASQAPLDLAWAYAIIRQESRFVNTAYSSVGARGLMQLMPPTAREIAQKVGLKQYDLNQIDNNTQLGTAYLAGITSRLHNNMVLGSVAYNAGASRAKRWQGSQPMDPLIYTESIPFDETRDYVQKVMANQAYYSLRLNQRSVSLQKNLGWIPAK
jgi:soluble lytic murein transglycosylase